MCALVTGVQTCALPILKEAHEAARLYLHPDDIATVGEDTTDGYRNLTIAADPLLPRGSVRLEAGGGEIEDGVRPRIARLEQALRAAGLDRKSVVSGKSVSVRVDLGGRRIIKKNNMKHLRRNITSK